jgi:flagellar biosynthesis protein FlhA
MQEVVEGRKKLILTLSIPLGIIGILSILILPLPPFFIDVCLALNITVSLIMLFASLYIDRPLEFSTYPALLLITTLFRLGMNVASTRLILMYGDQGTDAAGDVIQAFGEFVVGGNFAIGIVMFVAITIVNLKVITKGSGRIAEVAARFTLDAMPGKQMAIDSDLNTGLIKEAEAKLRRKELVQEAEFYGSMDGAAKFVAGDAVAGMFITALNIFGGFFIGVFQKNMDWMNAAQTYTLLTIGDGLVSQIPSIIISTSAGLIVARASSGKDLSLEVFGQLGASARPLFLAAGVCTSLALVPGLPFIPFILLAGSIGGLGYVRMRAMKRELVSKTKDEVVNELADGGVKPGSTEEVSRLLAMDTLELEVGYELVSVVEGGDLVERIRSLRRQFALDYGFIIPPIHIRDNIRLKSCEYRFMLRGNAIGGAELKARSLLAMDSGGAGAILDGIPTKEPSFGLDAIWIPERDKERAQIAGYTVVDLATVIVTHVTELVKSHMAELLGRQETQHLVDTLAKDAPKVVEELIPSILSLGQVQQVLQNLLREHVSIRDMRTILETLADWGASVKQAERLTEFVRRRLARSITSKFVNPDGLLPLVSLNPALEKYLGDALQQSDEGSYLSLDPHVAQMIINRLAKHAEKCGELGYTPLILASSHIRPAFAHFVGKFIPGISVVSHAEIAPSIKVRSLGVVTIDEVNKKDSAAA